MMSLIDHRLRITLNDGRQMTGQLLAFDTHMNLVLSNTEEFRRIKSKKRKATKSNKKQKIAHGDTTEGARTEAEEDDDDDDDHEPLPAQEQKRTLGLVILRGENVISISVEAPPPESKRDAASVRVMQLTHSSLLGPDEEYLPVAALPCPWVRRPLVLRRVCQQDRRQDLRAARPWARRLVLDRRLASDPLGCRRSTPVSIAAAMERLNDVRCSYCFMPMQPSNRSSNQYDPGVLVTVNTLGTGDTLRSTLATLVGGASVLSLMPSSF